MSQDLFTPVVVPAVQMYNGRPATTSRDVARYFGKNHAHVMRDIKEIIDNQPELLGRSKHGSAYGEKTEGHSFELASYIDEQGKAARCISSIRMDLSFWLWDTKERKLLGSSWPTSRHSTP